MNERFESEDKRIETPQSVFEQFNRYNLIYPQASLPILCAILHTYLNYSNLDIGELAYTYFSDDQARHVRGESIKAHRANNVGSQPKELRIKRLWLDFRHIAVQSVRSFMEIFLQSHGEKIDVWRSSIERFKELNGLDELKQYIDILFEVINEPEFIQKARKRNNDIRDGVNFSKLGLIYEIKDEWKKRCEKRLASYPTYRKFIDSTYA